ncbi:7339_t:CDS:1 [Dentiscutata erythropus]|uniref:7339_t:CDS:1 n=1 Tax=Dentiscutata erythropus TaxID=1348616 RepID=A0A9N8ZMS0_9GLOM|nr:7339_t:CDS:1 [Dentiscutata erythropus]
MPRQKQKARIHVTTACSNCRRRRGKCNVLSSEEDKCIYCNEQNLRCIFIPGDKRGPKPGSANPSDTAEAYHNASMISPSSFFIYDERMLNNDQHNTSFSSSFSASDSNGSSSHSYSHTIATNINIHETIEITQPSLCFHEPIMPSNEQNIISSFSTSDLNDSEIPHLYINTYDGDSEIPRRFI